MGFVVPYAPKLIIIAGILIVAVKELCSSLLEMAGLHKDAMLSDANPLFGGPDQAAMEGYSVCCLSVSAIKASLTPWLLGEKGSLDDDHHHYQRPVNMLLARFPEECAVCLCGFEKGQALQLTPNCSHLFHRACIDQWLDQHHTTCPLCRASLASSPCAPPHV